MKGEQVIDDILPQGHERNVQTAQSFSAAKSFNYDPNHSTAVIS